MSKALIDIPKVMSSKEIAELMGKQHKHVLRDIRRLLDELKDKLTSNDGLTPAYQLHTDERGRTKEYKLDRNLTVTLISGYSVELRYDIVKRWEELEVLTREDQLYLMTFHDLIGLNQQLSFEEMDAIAADFDNQQRKIRI